MKWLFRGSLVVIILLGLTQLSDPNKGFKPLVQARTVSQVRNSYLFWSCVGSLALNFLFRIIFQNNNCSVSSPIYQSIKANASEWVSQFGDFSSTMIRNDQFMTMRNRYYCTEAYWNAPQGKPSLVYVNVGTDFDGLRGSEGFLYLFPNQAIPSYWLDNYWITHLDEDIYCYKIRGF